MHDRDHAGRGDKCVVDEARLEPGLAEPRNERCWAVAIEVDRDVEIRRRAGKPVNVDRLSTEEVPAQALARG
jgi:hypothetical protein